MELASATVAENQHMCHLCTKPLEVELNQVSAERSTDAGIVRGKKLVNFCAHMGVSSDGLPKNCPAAIYPLCNYCRSKIEFFWRLQKASERAKLEHSKVISNGLIDALDSTSGNSVSNSSANQEVLQLRVRVLKEHYNRMMAIDENRGPQTERFEEMATGQRETPSSRVAVSVSTTIDEADVDTNEQPSSSSSIAGNGTIEDCPVADSRASEIENDGAANFSEISNEIEDENMDFSDSSSDSNDSFEIALIQSIHKGVKYAHYLAAAPDDEEFFECGACRLKVPFPKIALRKKAQGPRVLIKKHIEMFHLNA